jgi:hypothetical protein
LVGAENGRPSLEVRFRSDGHPPFTEREREIHLNGIRGVKFCRRPGLFVDPGLFFSAMPNLKFKHLKFAR